jgi:hypothetical protein
VTNVDLQQRGIRAGEEEASIEEDALQNNLSRDNKASEAILHS